MQKPISNSEAFKTSEWSMPDIMESDKKRNDQIYIVHFCHIFSNPPKHQADEDSMHIKINHAFPIPIHLVVNYISL